MAVDKGNYKSARQQLGLDAEIASKQLPNDSDAQERMRNLGKGMADPGYEYLGSFATHMYLRKDLASALTGNRDGAMKHQLCVPGDVSESFVSMAVADLAVKLRTKLFGHKPKGTLDKKDKRNEDKGEQGQTSID